MIETLGDAMHHRILQPLVMQHRRIDEGGEFRLAADDVFRLGADTIPDGIERTYPATLRIDLMHCHGGSRCPVPKDYNTVGGRLSRARQARSGRLITCPFQ